MPTFDGSSSRPSHGEADLLRAVLGSPRRRATSLRAASRAYHRRQRRTMLRRAVVGTLLVGSFLGSAALMSRNTLAPVSVASGMLRDPVATGSIMPVPELGRPEDSPDRRP